MVENKQEKPPKPPPKSFLAVGPTLHYSHSNVKRCRAIALTIFFLTALFWSKLSTGSLLSLEFNDTWNLGATLLHPLSIFEYPWQIVVLGILMGIFVAAPILVSQLMSFKYSLSYILIVALIAKLPGLAIVLLLCCVATASRPLRFRSRFIAIVLCTSPLLLYWAYFGGAQGVESIQLGLSYAPWLYAWLTALTIAAIVIGIGHFTRYRPGLIWSTTMVFLIAALVVFQMKVNCAELDYQLYIAKNDPKRIAEFHDHSITELLDKTIKESIEAGDNSYFARFFYPDDTILLRADLKREIQNRLANNSWPIWLGVPENMRYQAKKEWLLSQYDSFVAPEKKWTMPPALHMALLNSDARIKRMPTALYYKALLTEYTPDLHCLGEKEILRFYSDYPNKEALPIWDELYTRFGQSAESIEARWRIAMYLARQGKFLLSNELIIEALDMADELLGSNSDNKSAKTLKKVFAGTSSAITDFELKRIKRKLLYLQSLVGPENMTEKAVSREKLAKFVMLNRHETHYAAKLKDLLSTSDANDPLNDNILLARIMLIPDPLLRAEQFSRLAEESAGTDGGIQAKFELAELRLNIYKEQGKLNPSEKQRYLLEARKSLQEFIDAYPNSIFTAQTLEQLAQLPKPE